jgi:hypothetical protein
MQRDKLMEKTIIISKRQNSSKPQNFRKQKKLAIRKKIFQPLFTAVYNGKRAVSSDFTEVYGFGRNYFERYIRYF